MKSKLLALGLVALASQASAAGLLGTTKSFSTTAFCKTYKCEWANQGETSTGQWIYETKFGDLIGIVRHNKQANGKIINAIFTVPGADSDYYPEDNKTFAELQRSMFGYKAVDLSMSCYNSTKVLKRFTHEGKKIKIGCASVLGSMIATIAIE